MSNFAEIIENFEPADNRETKKFVFHLYDENIDFIESLSASQKNALINQLLHSHRQENQVGAKKQRLLNLLKKIGIGLIFIIIGIPIIIMIINFSFDATLNSYSIMEQNFQKLFDK